MTHILITSIGRVYVFDVLECAKLYQLAYGGTLTSKQVEDSIQNNLHKSLSIV